MEIHASKPKNNPNQSLPPKRGQIKKKILTKFFKSAVIVVSIAGRSGRKGRENERALSSSFSTPYETPSGYNSVDHSGGLSVLST